MPGKRAFNWVFTLNNYTDEDIKNILTWTEKGAAGVAYAHEVGASGTPHLQGYIHMKDRAHLKRMKGLSGKCHWEPMKGKLRDSEKYCSKQGKLIVLGKDPAAAGDGWMCPPAANTSVLYMRRSALIGWFWFFNRYYAYKRERRKWWTQGSHR